MDSIFSHRIAKSYRLQKSNFDGHKGSFWSSIESKNDDIDAALNSEDFNTLARILSDPVKTELFYGMDILYSSSDTVSPATAPVELIRNSLYFLGEATGAIGISNPEANGRRVGNLDLEDLLGKIEEITQIPIEFPNPFDGEYGLPSTRGMISHRAILGIYQAWRTLALTRIYGNRVLEIGGGTGRAAYYARRAGILDYTIVDIPMTSVAQATWLGEVIGPQNIELLGEEQSANNIKLVDQQKLIKSGKNFDLVVNVDSMTEMALQVATDYVDYIVSHSKTFLSMNHEVNHFKVCDLPGLGKFQQSRNYCWIRPGYVEEIFKIEKKIPENSMMGIVRHLPFLKFAKNKIS